MKDTFNNLKAAMDRLGDSRKSIVAELRRVGVTAPMTNRFNYDGLNYCEGGCIIAAYLRKVGFKTSVFNGIEAYLKPNKVVIANNAVVGIAEDWDRRPDLPEDLREFAV